MFNNTDNKLNNNNNKKIIIIGAGFSGLSAAAYLAQQGYEVHIYEKNDRPGGRARHFKTENGFTFDMGPSWYWMPDVFEKFFKDFGYSTKDFYDLKLLDPAFDIVYKNFEIEHIPTNFEALGNWFEEIETGSKKRLNEFMTEAQYKYETSFNNLIYKPNLSISEYFNWQVLKGIFKMDIFTPFSSHVRKYFSHPKLIYLMEFPILFLGAQPESTPALYSLMNYAGLKLGTWYPQGGFEKVVQAFVKICTNNGTTIHYKANVEKINIENNQVKSIQVNGEQVFCDALIGAADYHHIEQNLLPAKYRNYSSSFWYNSTLAPSCLIFYLGLNKKINKINHHTLFFDENLSKHATEIYKTPQWPTKPLFYVCCPSVTDPTVAAPQDENLFFLMPLAPGLQDTEELRNQYFNLMLDKFELTFDFNIKDHIIYKQSYCIQNFIDDYNAFKGNAYGLANTLKQTAILKPKMINKMVKNLFYCGQLTVPGPGVPPAIISGKIVAELLSKKL